LSLAAVEQVFGDRTHAQRVLAIYVSKGVVAVTRDPEEEQPALPGWKVREVLVAEQNWRLDAEPVYYVHLTDHGARAWSDGRWDTI
jgi:hypothetical protein